MGVLDQGNGTFECQEHGYIVIADSLPTDDGEPVPQSDDYHDVGSACDEAIQRAVDFAQREQQS